MRMPPALRTLFRSGPAGVALAVTTAVALLAAATGFLDPLSLLITVGGALGVTWATFPRARLTNTWQYLSEALGGDTDAEELVRTFKRLAGIHRVEGVPALERAAAVVPDPSLRRAFELSFECRDEDELTAVLLAEAHKRAAEGEAARHVMLTLGKLFPAFGLIGTLIGLVLLLRNLAGADFAAIGPGLGIAVLTTLYGAVLSNVVVLPLATKLQAHLARQALRAQMIIEGTLLVYRGEYGTRVERVLRAHVDASIGSHHGRVVRLAASAAA